MKYIALRICSMLSKGLRTGRWKSEVGTRPIGPAQMQHSTNSRQRTSPYSSNRWTHKGDFFIQRSGRTSYSIYCRLGPTVVRARCPRIWYTAYLTLLGSDGELPGSTVCATLFDESLTDLACQMTFILYYCQSCAEKCWKSGRQRKLRLLSRASLQHFVTIESFGFLPKTRCGSQYIVVMMDDIYTRTKTTILTRTTVTVVATSFMND